MLAKRWSMRLHRRIRSLILSAHQKHTSLDTICHRGSDYNSDVRLLSLGQCRERQALDIFLALIYCQWKLIIAECDDKRN